MKIFFIIVAVIGFFIIAGTAGASDMNPTMSFAEIIVNVAFGLVLVVGGLFNAYIEE